MALLTLLLAPKLMVFRGEAQVIALQKLTTRLTDGIKLLTLKRQLTTGRQSPIDYQGITISFLEGLPNIDESQMRHVSSMPLPPNGHMQN